MVSSLIKKVKSLKRSKIKKEIQKRIKEFEKIGKDKDKIFEELCFCILTANYSAERAIKIQEKINKDFLQLPEKELAEKLKKLGHRFPYKRAHFIVKAREKKEEIIKKVKEEKNEFEIREYLVKNIKGLGYKEASHFLRNIGFKNVAIIDFHILDVLEKHKIIKTKPSSLTKTKYLEIENLLKNLASFLNLTLAELDLYLWYLETGKVLK